MSDAFGANTLLPAKLSARTALDHNSLIRISVVLAVMVTLIVALPGYLPPFLTRSWPSCAWPPHRSQLAVGSKGLDRRH